MFKILFSAFLVFGLSLVSCKKNSSCIGKPVPNCISTKEYAPVCGCDGKVYDNASTASCAGIKSWTIGICH